MTTILTLLEQIQIGNPKIIQHTLAAYLQTAGANLDQTQYIEIPGLGKKEYLTPLMLAARMGQASTIVLLLQQGADINHIHFQDGRVANTALIQGIKSEDLQIVKLLLQHGAEINSEKQSPLSQNRVTCFHCALIPATQLQRIDILNLLLQYGANIDALDHTKSAFATSLQMWGPNPTPGQMEVTEFLIRQGGGCSSNDAYTIFYNVSNLTPLLYATRRVLIYHLFEKTQRLLPALELDNKISKKNNKMLTKERVQHNNKISKPAQITGLQLAKKTPFTKKIVETLRDYIFESEECRQIITYEFERARKNPAPKKNGFLKLFRLSNKAK